MGAEEGRQESMSNFRRIAVTGLMGLCAISASCESEKTEISRHVQVPPKVAFDFPEKPDFLSVVEKNFPQNGVYTTWGVIFNQDRLWSQTVRVRGTIVDISRDCPFYTTPRKKAARGRHHRRANAEPVSQEQRYCPGLSVVLSAPEGSMHPLRLVGYHPYYHPHLKPGMELDVTGQYLRFTTVMGRTYVESVNGLLVVEKIHNLILDNEGNVKPSHTTLP